MEKYYESYAAVQSKEDPRLEDKVFQGCFKTREVAEEDARRLSEPDFVDYSKVKEVVVFDTREERDNYYKQEMEKMENRSKAIIDSIRKDPNGEKSEDAPSI